MTEKHNNNFNLLRLIFALLVIVSHGPELIDGNRSREVLTLVFGTYSFGEFAVNSFFILSGYLITASWLSRPDLASFMRKRLLRIAPGFLAAVAVSLALFGPMSSPSFWREVNLMQVVARLPLFIFDAPGFPGSTYPLLNGALWTIHYEFVCYLLLAALGVTGVLRRPKIVFALFGCALTGYLLYLLTEHSISLSGALKSIWWRFGHYIRFTSFFLSGASLYFLRDRISAHATTALAMSIICFAPLMFGAYAAPIAMAIPWAILLYLAGNAKIGSVGQVGGVDLSYGIYLYAWPIEQILIQRTSTDVFVVIPLTAAFSAAAAAISWYFVEKPALRLKDGKSNSRKASTVAS